MNPYEMSHFDIFDAIKNPISYMYFLILLLLCKLVIKHFIITLLENLYKTFKNLYNDDRLYEMGDIENCQGENN